MGVGVVGGRLDDGMGVRLEKISAMSVGMRVTVRVVGLGR